ncbi:MAG: thioredoxin [Lachnospiraceae bacterium]|nr:thioredoxin [Lachnospiraceae bacterium]
MEKIITDANFDEEVIKSEKPFLVDFYADWCGPCKMLAPVIEKIANAYDGKIFVGKCNVDDNPGLSQKFSIMSIPTLMLIKGGEVVWQNTGVVPEGMITGKIDEIL